MAQSDAISRKTILASLGVALLVAGLALIGSTIGAVVDAPAKRGLTVEWVILGVAIAIAIALGGGYVFAAALSERLSLPGMTGIRREEREHAFAVLLLTAAVHWGNDLAAADEADMDVNQMGPG